jgi:hypothetical protein
MRADHGPGPAQLEAAQGGAATGGAELEQALAAKTQAEEKLAAAQGTARADARRRGASPA